MAKWSEWLNSMRTAAIALFIIGIVLSGVGMGMRAKQNSYTVTENEIVKGELVKKGGVVKGNKATLAAGGAAVGAAVGAGAGAAIGGVGIVACGTGIGIPVGLLCLGAAAVLGCIGAGAGAMAGTSDQVVPDEYLPDQVITREITNYVNAYSPWEYWTVICIGAILVALALWLFFKSRKQLEEIPLFLAD